MKNRKIIILFTLIFSMGLFTQGTCQEAPDNLVLDLQGAVDHAISFNKPLKNARLEVERSRARNWEAISQGLPQIDGGMDYSSLSTMSWDSALERVVELILPRINYWKLSMRPRLPTPSIPHRIWLCMVQIPTIMEFFNHCCPPAPSCFRTRPVLNSW